MRTNMNEIEINQIEKLYPLYFVLFEPKKKIFHFINFYLILFFLVICRKLLFGFPFRLFLFIFMAVNQYVLFWEFFGQFGHFFF